LLDEALSKNNDIFEKLSINWENSSNKSEAPNTSAETMPFKQNSTNATNTTTSREQLAMSKSEKNRKILAGIHSLTTFKEINSKSDFGELGFRSLLKEKEHISEELLKNRSKYLCEQRNKLLMKKSDERERQAKGFAQYNADRPNSARVAVNALTKNLLEERKEIAEKLKSEVINNRV